MNKKVLEKIVIRFSGDSGDGIQLLGNQFSNSSIIESENDIYTFVEFPSEIRAPAGSLAGISSFQLSISSKKLYTVDDEIDLLIAFNPAALKSNITNLKYNASIIIDIDTFTEKNLKKAGFEKNPLLDDQLKDYNVIKISITQLTYECVKNLITSVAKAKRCKNFFILGVICWMFDRKIDDILVWLEKKFKNENNLCIANKTVLKVGYNYSNTVELFQSKIFIPPYKNSNKFNNLSKISGNKAFCLGSLMASILFELPLFSANYPITPATDILQELSLYINDNIKIIQLEDEIAAISATIGASYGGALSFTCTSGPGLDLMQESLGLALMAKLPLLVLNIQRSGPSTGIPTKSEQTDLLASIFGRHGESSLVVLAPNSPSECFWSILEGFCLAITYLGPVIILSDANLANSFELWEHPTINTIAKKINFNFKNLKNKQTIHTEKNTDINSFNSWIVPGKKNFQMCIGGLERDYVSNDVSHDGLNHNKMILYRNECLNNITNYYADLEIDGPNKNEVILITWGSVYGAVKTVYEELKNNFHISLLCIKYLNPMHHNLEKIIYNFKKIIVIEENLGQLAMLLQAKYLIKVLQINQISGKPFKINYLKLKILSIMKINNE